MVLRTWSKVLLTALGMTAATGAGQLGFGYGLGIVRFNRDFLAGAEHHWPGQLAWVAWFAMVAAVLGAAAAARLAARYDLDLSLLGRAGIASVAGLGTMIVAPLTMQPARAAQIAPALDPVLTVGLTAILGSVAGVVLATATLSARVLAWNMAAFIGAVWVVALASVAPSLGPHDALPTVRLAVLDLPGLAAGTTRNLALFGIPVLALLLGAATAGAARLRGPHLPETVPARHTDPATPSLWPIATEDTDDERTLPDGRFSAALPGERFSAALRVAGRVTANPGTAVCGAAGPGILALAYLLAGPGNASTQSAPYWASLIGLVTGALGSVLVTLVPDPRDAAGTRATIGPDGATNTRDEYGTGDDRPLARHGSPDARPAASSRPRPPVTTPSSPSADLPASEIPPSGSRPPSGEVPASGEVPSGRSGRPAGRNRPRPGPGRAAQEPAVAPATGSASATSSASATGSASGPSAALTEPTPDPLTAPLEQLRLGRRSPRQRGRTGTPDRSTGGAGPKPVAPTPAPARPIVPEPALKTVPQPTPETAPLSEPAPPIVPEPVLKTVPEAALRPVPEPRPAAEGRSWLSLRRWRVTTGDGGPTGEPTAATGGPAAPSSGPAPTSAGPSGTSGKPEPAESRKGAPRPGSAPPEEPQRSRFGLLRRSSRSAPAPREAAEPEKIRPRDEEYVDWVAGLGSDHDSRDS